MEDLKKKLEAGFNQAICSKGKNKGMLKAKCPPMDSYGAAVWNAIMSYSNPYKVGMGHMLLMSKDCREVYDEVVRIGKHFDLRHLDVDGKALRSLNLIQ